MKVYLAGPMTGIPDFNYPAFKAKAYELRRLGHFVFSPAERDIEREGKDLCTGTTGDLKEIEQHGFSKRVALGDDLAWICGHAEAVYMLPGWNKSSGATAERATALALGLQIMGEPA
jgi:hypothetical protein